MATPNGGLITETNRQYYAGAQGFTVSAAAGETVFTFTFNTDLVLGNFDPTTVDYGLNNFKLYTSPDGLTYTEYITTYTLVGNTITLGAALAQNSVIVCQLKSLEGGNYGDRDAYGTAVENNYGGYAYTTLNDIINNFLVAYVGAGKLIPSVKRTDLVFHAKRGLQEFSYDTLKSIKSQELNIPPSLSVALPQDYVNYVRMSWIDSLGVQHLIYPNNNLTDNPYTMPTQDDLGIPIQDNFDTNIEGTSITEERWAEANTNLITQAFDNGQFNQGLDWWGYDWGYGGYWYAGYGQAYGLDPQRANVNGSFNMNEREGKVSFSNDLVGKLIILEYISDGLAYDMDSRIPKMAEEALYAHIIHAVLASRINQPEYIVQRLKRERSAKLRNAKIRLSNIKLEEFTQVMRGKSKWIKH
tara:strand:+ start:5301 stop:6539 length:1239 start_codon:yes stop_codon:yes gene_type:complete